MKRCRYGPLQLFPAVECCEANRSSGDQCKEPFDPVQPGAAGGGEMEVESVPPLRLQPALHLGTFVGAVGVHNEMHFLIGRKRFFDLNPGIPQTPGCDGEADKWR